MVFGLLEQADWFDSVDWSPFSVVVVGGRCPKSIFHTVKVDVAQAAWSAFDTLARRVPGKIGVILHRHTHELPDDRLREGAMRTFFERLPAERRLPIHFDVFTAPFDDQVKRAREWLSVHQPQGLIGFILAREVASYAGFPFVSGEQFIPLEQDRSFVKNPVRGPLESSDVVAERAVDLLDTMIRHGETGVPSQPLEILVAPTWHEPAISPVLSPVQDGVVG